MPRRSRRGLLWVGRCGWMEWGECMGQGGGGRGGGRACACVCAPSRLGKRTRPSGPGAKGTSWARHAPPPSPHGTQTHTRRGAVVPPVGRKGPGHRHKYRRAATLPCDSSGDNEGGGRWETPVHATGSTPRPPARWPRTLQDAGWRTQKPTVAGAATRYDARTRGARWKSPAAVGREWGFFLGGGRGEGGLPPSRPASWWRIPRVGGSVCVVCERGGGGGGLMWVCGSCAHATSHPLPEEDERTRSSRRGNFGSGEAGLGGVRGLCTLGGQHPGPRESTPQRPHKGTLTRKRRATRRAGEGWDGRVACFWGKRSGAPLETWAASSFVLHAFGAVTWGGRMHRYGGKIEECV